MSAMGYEEFKDLLGCSPVLPLPPEHKLTFNNLDQIKIHMKFHSSVWNRNKILQSQRKKKAMKKTKDTLCSQFKKFRIQRINHI